MTRDRDRARPYMCHGADEIKASLLITAAWIHGIMIGIRIYATWLDCDQELTYTSIPLLKARFCQVVCRVYR